MYKQTWRTSWPGVVVLVMLSCLNYKEVACCWSSKDCGGSYTNQVCCLSVHPSRCMEISQWHYSCKKTSLLRRSERSNARLASAGVDNSKLKSEGLDLQIHNSSSMTQTSTYTTPQGKDRNHTSEITATPRSKRWSESETLAMGFLPVYIGCFLFLIAWCQICHDNECCSCRCKRRENARRHQQRERQTREDAAAAERHQQEERPQTEDVAAAEGHQQEERDMRTLVTLNHDMHYSEETEEDTVTSRGDVNIHWYANFLLYRPRHLFRTHAVTDNQSRLAIRALVTLNYGMHYSEDRATDPVPDFVDPRPTQVSEQHENNGFDPPSIYEDATNYSVFGSTAYSQRENTLTAHISRGNANVNFDHAVIVCRPPGRLALSQESVEHLSSTEVVINQTLAIRTQATLNDAMHYNEETALATQVPDGSDPTHINEQHENNAGFVPLPNYEDATNYPVFDSTVDINPPSYEDVMRAKS